MKRFFIYIIILFTLSELTGLFFNRIFPPVAATAVVRSIQIILFLVLSRQMKLTEYFFGEAPFKSFKKGILISSIIGVIVLVLVMSSKYIFSFHILRLMLFKYKANYIMLMITGGLIGPFAEELFFRGVIYNLLREKTNLHTSVFITSLIFAGFHLGDVKIPIVQLAGGFLFTYIYAYSKNIIPAVVVHGIGNIAIFSIPLIYKTDLLRSILF